MQGNWSGSYNGDWFGDSGDSPDYVIAGLTVTGTGVAVFSPIVQQGFQDTHDGYWTKRWLALHKKIKKAQEVKQEVIEEIAEIAQTVKVQKPIEIEARQDKQVQDLINQQLMISSKILQIKIDAEEDDIEAILMMI